jgi:AcrR family transcriptional regulator
MKHPQTPLISARKRPRQARSTHLVAAILEAATRVLAHHGAQRFTTARVAEEAGVSVGSLYQYFPNKQSILFRLQTDEWQQTSTLLDRILTDESLSPQQRLRSISLAFFRSECEEAELRVALKDAAPLYRDVPETREHRAAGKRRVLKFMRELLPEASAGERTFAADLVMTAMSAVGKAVSEQNRSRSEVDRMATAMGEMFCVYLERLATPSTNRG